MDIKQKFENTIKSYNMINKGVIACVSGGADSICMLYLLSAYCNTNNITIICAHFNHGIRGQESDRDEGFVRDTCKALNIELFSEYCDIPKLAEEMNKGIEETARIARYDFFKRIADQTGYSIAIAHNRNDRVETIIHNILRGTSPEGLKGITYIRDNIVRPMLDIERSEIEEYLFKNKIEYINDSTNMDTAYTRNRIRHLIIPFLEEQYGNISDSLIRLSELAISDNDYLNMIARESYSIVVKDNVIDVSEYSARHYAVRSRILKQALSNIQDDDGKYVYKAGMNIEMSMINRVDDFIINGSSGKYVEISRGNIAKKEYDRVYLLNTSCNSSEIKESIESEKVSFSDFDIKLLEDKDCACFDYEKLSEITQEEKIKIRTRQEGDIFIPYGNKGKKKLKKFFIDEKIPSSKRDSMLLLASGSNILWIPGIRRSSIAPIDNNTKTVIIFRLYQKYMEDLL